MNKTLYVITPIFNPCLFKSRIKLYNNFKHHMEESGVKLLTVEAAFGKHDWEATTHVNPMNLQFRTNQILWHKERLINLGLEYLYRYVPDAEYIAWIDSDVTFANPNWVEETIHKLMYHKVIQPFSQAINLNAREESMWTCPGTFSAFINERGYHQNPPILPRYLYKGHPGLAWASTKTTLQELGGLYDLCVAGSGDTVMANCFRGKWDSNLPAFPSEGISKNINEWSKKCDKYVIANVGYANGSCLHHWHGKSEDRGYEKRWSVLSFHKFEPLVDVIVDHQGLYAWAGNKPQLEYDIRLSLTGRNEDA